MHDPLLEHVIALAEEDTPIEAEVTLIVGGMLVTGHVIGYDKYMSHHALTQAYSELDAEADDDAEAEEAGDEEEGEDEDEDLDDEAAFVHLRDARLHAAGQSPSGTGGFYRIALADVAGFSLVR